MKLEICTWPDDVLAAKAEPVAGITPELEKLIEDMVETMYEGDGVGLAAPQVGESIRLICVDQTGPKLRADLRVLINPEIVECDGEVESEEGCLSCPEFSGTVMRKERVKVTGNGAGRRTGLHRHRRVPGHRAPARDRPFERHHHCGPRG